MTCSIFEEVGLCRRTCLEDGKIEIYGKPERGIVSVIGVEFQVVGVVPSHTQSNYNHVKHDL